MFKFVAIFYMRRQKSAVIMLILGKPYIYGHFSGLWGKPKDCREIWGLGHSGEGSAKAKTIGSDSGCTTSSSWNRLPGDNAHIDLCLVHQLRE